MSMIKCTAFMAYSSEALILSTNLNLCLHAINSNTSLLNDRFATLLLSLDCLMQLLLFPNFCTVVFGGTQGDFLLPYTVISVVFPLKCYAIGCHRLIIVMPLVRFFNVP